ncbi:MAG: PRC-barrel domain-containing protein [Thermosynechococcaceae cyanobacterium]
MRKGTDLINKPIVTFDTGEINGRVKDLIFDQNQNILVAFLVEESQFLSPAKILSTTSVQSIGADAVITATKDNIISVSKVPDIKAILDRNNILKNTHIMTVDGRDLGKMLDLYFDEKTGLIEGYEVSGGLFADVYSGRSFVPAVETLKIGEHFAFVPSMVAILMEEQVGGIKGAMFTVNDKVQEAAQKTSETVQSAASEVGTRLEETRQQAATALTNSIIEPEEQKAFVLGKATQIEIFYPEGILFLASGHVITETDITIAQSEGILDQLYHAAGGDLWQEANGRLKVASEQTAEQVKQAAQTAGDKIQQATQQAGEQVSDLRQGLNTSLSNSIERADQIAAGYTIEQASGRRVLQVVKTRDGVFIAAPGQIVTDTVIERAKVHHQEQALLNAVGLSTTQAMRKEADGAIARAGQTTHNLGHQATYAWSWVKESVDEVRERSTQALEEKRIRGALGRPVTRVILDRQDRVLLNVGECITHEAIETARQEEALDILLNSVYTKTPEFSNAELQATESGRAALKSVR